MSNHRLFNFINVTFKCCFCVVLLFVFQQNSNAQSATAPNECKRTPFFSVGNVDLVCPLGEVPVPLFNENFDKGFGTFSLDLPSIGNINNLTTSSGGKTPSVGTGPETTASCSGSRNKGEFIFLEGSSNLFVASNCMSTKVDLSSANGQLDLSVWYHMFGDDIGKLEIKVDGAPEFAISGQQQTANGQAWQQAIVDLTGHAGNLVDVQICMSDGAGGSSNFSSDISVDQVEVYGCGKPLPEDDILDFLPGIIATVERRPPPPPPPARWRVTNLIYCPSFKSEWTVSDGESSRSSLVRSQIISTPNTSSYVTVEAGSVDFSWRLITEQGFRTCGSFSNQFTQTLKPGFDYEFILEPEGEGLNVRTIETN